MKLYFVRHGESEANVLKEFSNRGLKHALTATGRQQASVLAQTLQGLPLIKIFSSPVLRAIQTAEILSCELDIPYETVDALREYDVGVLEGKSYADGLQLYSEVYDAWIWRHEWEKRIEQGESFLDIKHRFVPFIECLIQQNQSSPRGIVLVGHGGTYRCMLPLVLSNIDFQFVADHPLSYTTKVVAEVRATDLVCLSWGDTLLASE